MPSVYWSPLGGPTRKEEIKVMEDLKALSAIFGMCCWEATRPVPKNVVGSGSMPRSQSLDCSMLTARSCGEIGGREGGAAGW